MLSSRPIDTVQGGDTYMAGPHSFKKVLEDIAKIFKEVAAMDKRIAALEKKSHTGPIVYGPRPVDGDELSDSLSKATKDINWGMPHPDGVRDINLDNMDMKGVKDIKRVRPRFGPEK